MRPATSPLHRFVCPALSCVVLCGLILGPLQGAEPDIQAFAQKLVQAKKNKDAEALMAMTYMEGATETDRQKLKEMTDLTLKYSDSNEVKSIKIVPLSNERREQLNSPTILNGEKREISLSAEGEIHQIRENGRETFTPYGIKDGKVWLVGIKMTKLDWNGPPEDSYFITTSNSGDAEVPIRQEWVYRASGELVHRKNTVVARKHGSTGFGVHANELVFVRISTANKTAKLEVTIRKDLKDSKEQQVVFEQKIDAEKPFVFPVGAKEPPQP